MPPQDFTKMADGVANRAVGVFGETVTYIPLKGAQFSITGIFDNLFEQIDPDTERVVASNQPNLGFREEDLPKPPEKGDRVKLRGKTYRIVDSQEDGVAMIRVMLHEVPNG